MEDFVEPANSNKSFTDIMRDPKRELARDTVKPIAHLLKKSGVPGPVISDVLFEFALLEMYPRENMSGSDAVRYFAHLKRFHQTLQDRIKEIENNCDDLH